MRETIVHVSIIEPERSRVRTDYHSLRVDAPELLGELVELHEIAAWGQPYVIEVREEDEC